MKGMQHYFYLNMPVYRLKACFYLNLELAGSAECFFTPLPQCWLLPYVVDTATCFYTSVGGFELGSSCTLLTDILSLTLLCVEL